MAISNTDNIIDSRDVIERIEELESEVETQIEELQEEIESLQSELEELQEEIEENGDEHPGNVLTVDTLARLDEKGKLRYKISNLKDKLDNFKSDESEELEALNKLKEQCEYFSDWKYGLTLISEHYFQTYAEELASDIGAIDSSAGWPLMHIDWEEAAESLKTDYTEVDFDGVTFYCRE